MRKESTVFIVDDDKGVRDALVNFLEYEGLSVETYASANDFLDSGKTEQSGCLLLDVKMPGMSGLDLQRVLAEKNVQMPVIFITGHGDVPMSVKALKAGAFNFIEKPFECELLLTNIKEAIAEDQLTRQARASSKDDLTNDFNESYAESVVEIMRLPLLVLEENLRIVSTNRSFTDLLQISTDENEQSLLDNFALNLWKIPQLRERVELVVSDNVEIQNLEVTINHPKIGYITLLVNARQLQQKNDHKTRVLFVMEDISARKKMEETILKEKERAQITLDSINEAVITTDADGRVIHLNPVAEKMVGWPAEVACGQKIDIIVMMVNEKTNEFIVNPVFQSLHNVQVIKIEEPTFLISHDKQKIIVDCTASPIQDRSGSVLGAVLVLKDVTEQRQITAELAYAANHDPLTGLVNRREFEKRLQRAIESSTNQGLRHTLCFIDLDKFKVVNDTVGHAAGDDILRQVTILFQKKLRDRDTLARLGGDEFGLLFENCKMDKATEIIEIMAKEIDSYNFIWKGHSFKIGASVGLVPITGETKNPSELLSQADLACYGAKRRGRRCVHVLQSENKHHQGTIHQ